MSTEDAKVMRNADWRRGNGVDGAVGNRFWRNCALAANKCADQKGIDAPQSIDSPGVVTRALQLNISRRFPSKTWRINHGYISVTITDMERKRTSTRWPTRCPAAPGNPPKGATEVGVIDDKTYSQSSLIQYLTGATAEHGGQIRSGAKDDYYTHLHPPCYLQTERAN